MNKQPDIEIYVRDATVDDLRGWLEKRLGPLTAQPSGKTMAKFTVDVSGIAIPVRITPGVVGKIWTSVWLDSPDTPWADDLACARDCYAMLGKEVRCTAGGWHEEEDPDSFLKITADGEKTITWKTE